MMIKERMTAATHRHSIYCDISIKMHLYIPYYINNIMMFNSWVRVQAASYQQQQQRHIFLMCAATGFRKIHSSLEKERERKIMIITILLNRRSSRPDRHVTNLSEDTDKYTHTHEMIVLAFAHARLLPFISILLLFCTVGYVNNNNNINSVWMERLMNWCSRTYRYMNISIYLYVHISSVAAVLLHIEHQNRSAWNANEWKRKNEQQVL